MPQSSLIRASILSTVGVLVQGVARFIYTVLVARFFGPEQLAVVNTLLSLSIIASLFWPTAAGNAAGTFLARVIANGVRPQRVLSLLWRSFFVSAGVLVLVSVPIAVLVVGADAIEATVFAFLVVGWSGYIFTRGIRMGLGQVGGAAIWDAVSAVITLALLALVIAGGVSPLILAPLAIGYLSFTVAAWRSTRLVRADDPEDAVTRPTEMWHLIGWNSAGLIATNGLIQFSMVFAFITSDASDAGQYAAAIALATPASMLAQAVSQVLIPRFATWLHVDVVDARRRYLVVLAVMTAMLAVAFGAVALIAPWLVPFLYGPGYTEAVGLVEILIAGVFLFSVGLIASSFLITSGRTVRSTWAAVAGLVTGLIVMTATAPSIGGALAASVGVLVGCAVVAVIAVAASVPIPRAMPVAVGGSRPD
ncbi:hypothetical protein WJX64_08325 [Leifsonia sp. YIM 134122]|uniref:Polysaccharide biosynthesis protein n=1 Tax=Leifsonia stereocauli TaxID=3134136 RepID=A0ABU9W3H3_9MICO